MSPRWFTLVCPFRDSHKQYFQALVHPLIDGFEQTLTSTFHLWLKIMIQCASFMERHCAAIAVIWKLHGNNSFSSVQIFSGTTCIFDSSTHPTQCSRPCWYCTKGGTMIWQILREQQEGSRGIIVPCFHCATSGSRLVLHVGWVMLLCNEQSCPKNTKPFEFFLPLYSHNVWL
jgi:hypothetical protein